ncbi:TraV family lipoprotein [Vibrio harveyi]|uniref:TraV family lipoprotein n=1 Tax=Vibrio harveyi TaxID=669 RepID=UPI003BB746D4
MKSIILTVFTASLLSGCSLLPYEEDFACDLTKNNLGQCITPEQAYQQALEDSESAGRFIQQDGTTSANTKDEPTHSAASWGYRGFNSNEQTNPKEIEYAPVDEYKNYKTRVYEEMAKLVDTPKAPMVKPAKTIRTLVMNYGDGKTGKRMYMPRYIYEIIEEPRFLMNQYRLKPTDVDSIDLLSTGE